MATLSCPKARRLALGPACFAVQRGATLTCAAHALAAASIPVACPAATAPSVELASKSAMATGEWLLARRLPASSRHAASWGRVNRRRAAIAFRLGLAQMLQRSRAPSRQQRQHVSLHARGPSCCAAAPQRRVCRLHANDCWHPVAMRANTTLTAPSTLPLQTRPRIPSFPGPSTTPRPVLWRTRSTAGERPGASDSVWGGDVARSVFS